MATRYCCCQWFDEVTLRTLVITAMNVLRTGEA
jgi:hypothetical protein